MAIWMDMTNSLIVWQGGAVGIIRVELETACSLKQQIPDLKVCAFDNTKKVFYNVTDDLDWLFTANNPLEAYLEHFGRNKKQAQSQKEIFSEGESIKELEAATALSESRLLRLKEGVKLWTSELPESIQRPVIKVLRAVYPTVRDICVARVKRKRRNQSNSRNNTSLARFSVTHPFKKGDSVFSCGWYTSGKENAFSLVKKELKDFKLSYLVFDLVLVKPETACFYNEKDQFMDYLHWVSANCDHVFYWGETAQKDAEALYKKNHWRVPSGSPAYCCSTMKIRVDHTSIEANDILNKLGVTGPYTLMVGSVEPKKNYDVIYSAYCLMAEMYNGDEIPQCVIVGSNFGSCKDLVHCMKEDVRVKDKFVFVRASDEELGVLYENALFTMVPSFYEGWSIVVAEMLSYGKLCIAADTPPLKEVGDDLVVYVDPLDASSWAQTIHHYSTCREEISVFEIRIANEWKPPTWTDMASSILSGLASADKDAHVFYDFTIGYAYAFSDSPALTGIPRAILLLARYLYSLLPNIHYFALTEMGYIAIDYEDIQHIIEGKLLDDDFQLDSQGLRKKTVTVPAVSYGKNITSAPVSNRVKARWLFASILPKGLQKLYVNRIKRTNTYLKDDEDMRFVINRSVDLPFAENDIVLTVGPGWPEWVEKCMEEEKKKKNFRIIQTIYDMTPVIIPHTHTKETISAFVDQFLPNVFKTSDYIIYGGKTAMRDAESFAQSKGWSHPIGYAIKWGNDIKNNKKTSKQRKKDIFAYYGIKEPYILTVGTVQRRKNQEVLYHAMLRLENKKCQLVVAGYPGWGYDDFLKFAKNDERCRGRIIFITPSDEELNCLYQNCLFTVLPSLYEGWSLTLPESLQYGKFCIAADADPLREIGGELIDYVNPYDVISWAKTIDYYLINTNVLRRKEERIKDNWIGTTWYECAEELASFVKDIQ